MECVGSRALLLQAQKVRPVIGTLRAAFDVFVCTPPAVGLSVSRRGCVVVAGE